jgi:hypothetical protein
MPAASASAYCAGVSGAQRDLDHPQPAVDQGAGERDRRADVVEDEDGDDRAEGQDLVQAGGVIGAHGSRSVCGRTRVRAPPAGCEGPSA